MTNDLKILTVIITALAIALVPVSAYEGSTGIPLDLDIGDIIPDDDTVGPTFYNMGVALYPSVKGDSGAAIIHHSDDNAEIVGVHRGGVCVLEDLSVNQPEIDVRSYPQFCTEDEYYYKSFSAWENVKDVLNLR